MCRVDRAYREENDKHSLDRELSRLAGHQYGVVATWQLVAFGATKDAIGRRMKAGRLHRLHRGVYAVGHLALTARSRDLAAVLACGLGAALSHRSAGVMWAVVRSAPWIEVTVSATHRPRSGMRVHRSPLHDEDRAVRDGIPVTSPARTLVDLADVLSERRLADAVHEAEVQRLFDLKAVERTLARLSGRKGGHRLRRVIAAYDGGPPITRSEAEVRFLQMCSEHALPTPQANVSLGGYEVDFHWRDAGVVVEVDGAAAHHTRRAFHEDRKRDRDLARQGLQVLRVTWRDLDGDGGRLAREIEAIRRARTT